MQRAVADGELDADALQLWSDVARKLGEHFDEAAAAAYWRNKADSLGYLVPEQIVPLTKAWWKVDKGDSIEQWQKAARQSHLLMQDLEKLVAQWRSQLRQKDGLAILDEVTGLLNRYKNHTSPVIAFEEGFQFALLLVMKAFDAGYPQDDASYTTWLGKAQKGLHQLDQALKWV